MCYAYYFHYVAIKLSLTDLRNYTISSKSMLIIKTLDSAILAQNNAKEEKIQKINFK